ncbi:MAG TPA: hypothetical protein VF423_08385 [Actinomycetes bacterium]
MHVRSSSAALLVAAALVLAPAAAAVADDAATAPGVTKSQVAKAKAQARKLERQAKASGRVVLGGTVKAVVPAVAPVVATELAPAVEGTPATLTFTVHGGRYKDLRGTDVTVTVLADAKVTRDGVVDLSAVLAGDHVVVKSRDFDFVVDRTTLVPTVTVTATVHRVVANAREAVAAPAV